MQILLCIGVASRGSLQGRLTRFSHSFVSSLRPMDFRRCAVVSASVAWLSRNNWTLSKGEFLRIVVTVNYYSALVGERSIAISLSVCVSVCLSVSISLEPLDRSSRHSVCRSPVTVARSSSGGVAIHCVLPVLWMTSRLVVMGRMATSVAILGRSLMSMNALLSHVMIAVSFVSKFSCVFGFK